MTLRGLMTEHEGRAYHCRLGTVDGVDASEFGRIWVKLCKDFTVERSLDCPQKQHFHQKHPNVKLPKMSSPRSSRSPTDLLWSIQ